MDAYSPRPIVNPTASAIRDPANSSNSVATPRVYLHHKSISSKLESALPCLNRGAEARLLLTAGADVNHVTTYGWSPLLVATQNRYYHFGAFLLDHGADPNVANNGGWTPLYLATDNRNIENGDYPTRKPDIDDLDYIKLLRARGANPNARMIDSTETRTIFTHQWLYEDGATAFLRAAQSSDILLMRLLLENGADPNIATRNNTTALMVASGIGWKASPMSGEQKKTSKP